MFHSIYHKALAHVHCLNFLARGWTCLEKNMSADYVLVKMSIIWMLDTVTFLISLTISDTREGWLSFVEANGLLLIFVGFLSLDNEVMPHARVKSSTNRPFFRQLFQANNKEILKQSISGLMCGFRCKRVSNGVIMLSDGTHGHLTNLLMSWLLLAAMWFLMKYILIFFM